jgi:hypothetical protein
LFLVPCFQRTRELVFLHLMLESQRAFSLGWASYYELGVAGNGDDEEGEGE